VLPPAVLKKLASAFSFFTVTGKPIVTVITSSFRLTNIPSTLPTLGVGAVEVEVVVGVVPGDGVLLFLHDVTAPAIARLAATDNVVSFFMFTFLNGENQ
jgi:hypothetical protein